MPVGRIGERIRKANTLELAGNQSGDESRGQGERNSQEQESRLKLRDTCGSVVAREVDKQIEKVGEVRCFGINARSCNNPSN